MMSHRRMTCSEALKARYKIVGFGNGGVSEYQIAMKFSEALRYFAYLRNKGFKVQVTAFVSDCVFYASSHDA